VGTLTSLSISGNAIVGNNLFVNGNLVYINVDTLQVEDPIINLGGGPNGAPLTTNDSKDRGLLLNYYTTAPVSAFMGWDNSNAEFALGSNVSVANEVVTFNQLGNVRASTFIGSLLGSATTAGTVTTNAQPNITSVGTLTILSVSGNANIANIGTGGFITAEGTVRGGALSTGGSLGVTGNANVGNLGTAGLITATGNITGGNLSGTLVTGTLRTAAQPNITSTGTLSSLSVTGNIASSGNISLGNSSLLGTANNISTITAGIFNSITGSGILPGLGSGYATLFTVYGSVVPQSKWIVTLMNPVYDPLNSEGSSLKSTIMLTTQLGGGFYNGSYSVIESNPYVEWLIITNNIDDSVIVTVRNIISGMDAGDYNMVWSAMRLL
jgi:hypothetical protein